MTTTHTTADAPTAPRSADPAYTVPSAPIARRLRRYVDAVDGGRPATIVTGIATHPDPWERAVAASYVIAAIDATTDTAVRARDIAFAVGYHAHQAAPASMYRPAGVSRAMFHKALDKAPAELPDMTPEEVAAACTRFGRVDAALGPLWHAMMAVRDDAVPDFINDPERTNPQIAAGLGVTPARISQMRNGTARRPDPARCRCGTIKGNCPHRAPAAKLLRVPVEDV